MFCFQVNSVITTVFVGLVVILILTEKSRGSRKGSRRGSRRESKRGVHVLSTPQLCSRSEQGFDNPCKDTPKQSFLTCTYQMHTHELIHHNALDTFVEP